MDRVLENTENKQLWRWRSCFYDEQNILALFDYHGFTKFKISNAA